MDPAPMTLETGFRRLDSGVLHVAAQTDMHACTGEM
ncbi:DAPG hydrolase family protein [Pseudarthrobacter phenanthrenivorans]